MRRATHIMKHKRTHEMDDLAASVGATAWTLIREKRHLIVDFHMPSGEVVRQVLSVTGSDWRVDHNVRAQLLRSVRAG